MYKIIGADNKEYGPVPLETLKQWIIEGRANARTLVMVEGEQYWRQLSTVPELAALLSTQQPTAPPPPSYIPPASTPKQNTMAIASFVCGLLAVFSCCCFGGFPFNILAVAFGIIALYQIKFDQNYTGKGMAIAGIILGSFSILIMILGWVFFFTSKEFRDMLLEYQRRWRI